MFNAIFKGLLYSLLKWDSDQHESFSYFERGKFHISHDASRLISIVSSRLKKSSGVSREIFNDLNFKMELIQGTFKCALLIFGVWLII